jgi:hypothetical protein
MPKPTRYKLLATYLLILLSCLSPYAAAHDNNIATFQIRRIGSTQWVYEVMTPLYGLDQSMRASMTNTTENNAELVVGSTEYKEKIVAHIKEGFKVTATNNSVDDKTKQTVQLTLGQGRIKLNDHLTILIFEIKGMPTSVEQLNFHLTNMSNNQSQNNMLRLIDGQRSQHYVLNKSNQFTAQDNGFFSAYSAMNSSTNKQF